MEIEQNLHDQDLWPTLHAQQTSNPNNPLEFAVNKKSIDEKN